MTATIADLPAMSLCCADYPMDVSPRGSSVNDDISTHPSATQPPGADAGPVVRKEYLRWASLEHAQRSAVIDRLYAVYTRGRARPYAR
jgi:hypothetical protein